MVWLLLKDRTFQSKCLFENVFMNIFLGKSTLLNAEIFQFLGEHIQQQQNEFFFKIFSDVYICIGYILPTNAVFVFFFNSYFPPGHVCLGVSIGLTREQDIYKTVSTKPQILSINFSDHPDRVTHSPLFNLVGEPSGPHPAGNN